MNIVEKIIELIKNDKEIAENLFLFSEFKKDVSLWTNPSREGVDYNHMQWLFLTDHPYLNIVGLNKKDNTIWCIDDEGDFHYDCDSLEDFPYEIIRGDCIYTENETVEEYFDKYKVQRYKETLERYEIWYKNNNIELNKNNIYHDGNRDLFTKYFEKK